MRKISDLATEDYNYCRNDFPLVSVDALSVDSWPAIPRVSTKVTSMIVSPSSPSFRAAVENGLFSVKEGSE